LKRQLLKFPDAKIKEILAEATEAIRKQGRGEEEAEDGPMPSNWNVRPRLPVEIARARKSARCEDWKNRNMAKGLCESLH